MAFDSDKDFDMRIYDIVHRKTLKYRVAKKAVAVLVALIIITYFIAIPVIVVSNFYYSQIHDVDLAKELTRKAAVHALMGRLDESADMVGKAYAMLREHVAKHGSPSSLWYGSEDHDVVALEKMLYEARKEIVSGSASKWETYIVLSNIADLIDETATVMWYYPEPNNTIPLNIGYTIMYFALIPAVIIGTGKLHEYLIRIIERREEKYAKSLMRTLRKMVYER